MARRRRGRRSGRPATDAAPGSPGDGPSAEGQSKKQSAGGDGPRDGGRNAPGGRQDGAKKDAPTSAATGARGGRRRRRGGRGRGPGTGGGKPPAEKEFSCGGVVVRDGACLVINPVRPDGRTIATLPKGHPEEGEDPPTAALREIWEETSVSASITARLGEVVYWYQREGKRIRKTVRMYLCAHVEGEPIADGFEVTRAYWMPLEQALDELAFPGDREMVAQAMARTPGA
ncbi:NUDIX hydrolase [Patulibacter minatonensis]|uniref:NUDIX hydrolase n=1 Tax=Patulibacter minatonensis TaxID=298163 RepID=UPI00047B9809|nr:NUDIX domain-containing protein [Patulibacter minatonensis]